MGIHIFVRHFDSGKGRGDTPSRPLGGKTPWEYLMENHRGVILFEPQVSHMYWTPTPA